MTRSGVKRLFLRTLFCALLLIFSLDGCAQSGQGMHDGYYTAQAAAFDAHGWKEYITIYVSGDKVVVFHGWVSGCHEGNMSVDLRKDLADRVSQVVRNDGLPFRVVHAAR
jgi:major membrane immunogen (membrane-anchored lipoprotein)